MAAKPKGRPAVVRLCTDTITWIDTTGNIHHSPLDSCAEALRLLSNTTRWVWAVPCEAVSLHLVTLPSNKRGLWARAVPYALEDQLAEDVDTLHFALGHALDNGRLPVAVMSQSLLRAELGRLAQAGCIPSAAVPEVLLLPWQLGEWSVLLEPDRAVVRTGRWEGWSTELALLPLLLQQALLEAGENKPERIRLWGMPGEEWTALDIPLHLEDHAHALEVFSSDELAISRTINLLQGAYGQQTHWRRWLKPWRSAAACAGVWLLAQGALQLHTHMALLQEKEQLRDQIADVFKAALPEVTRVVNPKVQIETKLRELQSTAVVESRFLSLLQQVGEPVSAAEDITIKGITYRDGQLELEIIGGDPATLDGLRQTLNEQGGLQADMRTSQRGDQMESRLSIKRTAS